jgi:hypothetical protein
MHLFASQMYPPIEIVVLCPCFLICIMNPFSIKNCNDLLDGIILSQNGIILLQSGTAACLGTEIEWSTSTRLGILISLDGLCFAWEE